MFLFLQFISSFHQFFLWPWLMRITRSSCVATDWPVMQSGCDQNRGSDSGVRQCWGAGPAHQHTHHPHYFSSSYFHQLWLTVLSSFFPFVLMLASPLLQGQGWDIRRTGPEHSYRTVSFSYFCCSIYVDPAISFILWPTSSFNVKSRIRRLFFSLSTEMSSGGVSI